MKSPFNLFKPYRTVIVFEKDGEQKTVVTKHYTAGEASIALEQLKEYYSAQGYSPIKSDVLKSEE